MSLFTALRASAVTLVAASSLLALGASPARAGSYEIRQCNDASNRAIGVSDGFMTPVTMSLVDGCSGGSGTFSLQAANNTIAPWGSEWQAGGAQFNVPSWMPNTLITKVQTFLSVAQKTGDATLSYGHVLTVDATSGKQWPSNIEVPAGAWNGFFNLDYVRSDAQGSKVVQILVQCYGPCDFQTSPTMMVHLPRITLTESAAPNVATVDATGLMDGTPQRGTRTVAVASSDADSGVHRVEVRSPAGVLVASSAAGADCSYTRPAPCPQSRPRVDIPVDTTRLPEGSVRPELWIYDAAGNVRKQALAALTIDNVPDPAAPPAGPNGTGGDPATGTLFMKKGTEKRTVNFGAKVTLKGQLVDAAGVPIQNAAIDVWQTIAQPGAPTSKAGTVSTGPDGRFSYAPASGSSRQLTFAYAARTGSEDYRFRLDARLTVRAKVTFSVSKRRVARGTLIRFTGKLRVDPLPVRSARIVIETSAKGGKGWFTAATVRTRAGGAYKWSGRFRARGTFKVRARVLGSSDVAARPTSSSTATISVR